MSTPLTSRRRSINLMRRSGGKNQVLSPQTRRSLHGQGDSPLESPQLPDVRNEEDAKERREKRRSRTLAQVAGSPLVRPVEDNQGETAKLTNDQLASHYVNCIKLSTENKITAKNAFNLHLIDHMNEMLKQRCEGALNFQMAGGTIFASAKIYASRVDAVHSETYKVMSSLGRGATDEGSDQESQEDSEKRDGGRKKKKRSKILENNASSLRMKKMDVSYQADPLDQYYSSVFDVASTSGLLVNHLGLCRDGITMRFDSDMESPISNNICGGKQQLTASVSPQKEDDEQMEKDEEGESDRSQEINGMFHELVKLAANASTNKAGVCPTLNSFQWTEVEDDTFEWHEERMSDQNGADPVAVINNLDSQPEFEDDDDDEVIMDSAPCDDDLPASAPFDTTETKTEPLDNLGAFPVGMDAELLTSFMPGEYSYFKPGAFSTWEGPNHWKMRVRKPPSSDAGTEKTAVSDQTSKGKKRKRNFYIDYKTLNFDVDKKEFEHTRKAKDVSKRIREKWSKAEDDRLLPSAGEYNVVDLAKCVLQPAIQIRPVTLIRSTKNEAQVPQVDSDKIGMYNYDNPNDKNNYCPNMTDDEDAGVQDLDDCGQGDIPTDFTNDYNRTDHVEGFPDMTLSQTQVYGSQFDVEAMLQGDHLISHPKKVEKISIAYAKKATRIDVRRLKAAMWTVLHEDSDTSKNMSTSSNHSTIQNGNESEDGGDPESTEEQKMFTDMYSILPKLMPTTMTENLSIPLAFTCLLHLANEKSLKITAKTDMSDLNIVEPLVDFV